MERLSETIGEITIVGLESVGKSVAFSFKNETSAVVVVEHLIDSSGTAVGWYQQGFDGRFDWRLVVLFVEDVFVLLAFVFFHLQCIKLLKIIVDWLYKVTAESETTLAS